MVKYNVVMEFQTDDDYGFDFIPDSMQRGNGFYFLALEFDDLRKARLKTRRILQGLISYIRGNTLDITGMVYDFILKAMEYVSDNNIFDYEDTLSGNYEGTIISFKTVNELNKVYPETIEDAKERVKDYLDLRTSQVGKKKFDALDKSIEMLLEEVNKEWSGEDESNDKSTYER